MSEASTRILAELKDAARVNSDWAAAIAHSPTLHIAVMAEPFLSYMLTGVKTVESRFSINRIAPYGRIRPGDVVLMKAGALIGYFTAAWVEFYDLTTESIQAIAARYDKAICGSADFWIQKSDKRYATLIGIKDVKRLPPITITKTDRSAWLTLPVAAPKRN